MNRQRYVTQGEGKLAQPKQPKPLQKPTKLQSNIVTSSINSAQQRADKIRERMKLKSERSKLQTVAPRIAKNKGPADQQAIQQILIQNGLPISMNSPLQSYAQKHRTSASELSLKLKCMHALALIEPQFVVSDAIRVQSAWLNYANAETISKISSNYQEAVAASSSASSDAQIDWLSLLTRCPQLFCHNGSVIASNAQTMQHWLQDQLGFKGAIGKSFFQGTSLRPQLYKWMTLDRSKLELQLNDFLDLFGSQPLRKQIQSYKSLIFFNHENIKQWYNELSDSIGKDEAYYFAYRFPVASQCFSPSKISKLYTLLTQLLSESNSNSASIWPKVDYKYILAVIQSRKAITDYQVTQVCKELETRLQNVPAWAMRLQQLNPIEMAQLFTLPHKRLSRLDHVQKHQAYLQEVPNALTQVLFASEAEWSVLKEQQRDMRDQEGQLCQLREQLLLSRVGQKLKRNLTELDKRLEGWSVYFSVQQLEDLFIVQNKCNLVTELSIQLLDKMMEDYTDMCASSVLFKLNQSESSLLSDNQTALVILQAPELLEVSDTSHVRENVRKIDMVLRDLRITKVNARRLVKAQPKLFFVDAQQLQLSLSIFLKQLQLFPVWWQQFDQLQAKGYASICIDCQLHCRRISQVIDTLGHLPAVAYSKQVPLSQFIKLSERQFNRRFGTQSG